MRSNKSKNVTGVEYRGQDEKGEAQERVDGCSKNKHGQQRLNRRGKEEEQEQSIDTCEETKFL